jgi:hypothetical protein
VRQMKCGFPERHRATGVRLRRSCRIADSRESCSRTPGLRLPLGACAGRLYKQSQFTRRRRAQLYKQTQFGVPNREEGCRREQTKPIGPDDAWGRRARSAVQTKPIGPAMPGSVVQTNPIWGGPSGVRRAIRRNKANSGSRPAVPRVKCAKQSQTWAGWGIWEPVHPGSLSCQTKPIRTLPRGTAPPRQATRANAPNKPNFRQADSPHHSNIPLFHRSSPMRIVRNKANSCHGVRRGKGLAGKELW